MKDKLIDFGSFRAHYIKTDKFKTITIRVILKSDAKKEEMTIRNFLTSFLTYSTATYKTKQEIAIQAQELYGVNIYTKAYRAGTKSMINFFTTMLNEKYTDTGMMEETIKFLADIIFNPNFNDKNKYQEAYDFLVKTAETAMKAIKENPTNYSIIRMLEEMADDVYSYRDAGYLEDLEAINKETLTKYYEQIIKESLVDVYVIGNFDEEEMTKYLKKYLIFETFKSPKSSQLITHGKLTKKIKEVKESVDGNQSKLSIGCKIGDLTEFERNYVLTLYNLIVGGSAESKFFKIIREKHSLAYYVSASLNKLDNLMIIKAGIAKENYNKTLKLIKELMREMVKGKFEEEDIEVAKKTYITLLKEVEDSETAIIETYLAKDLLNLGDINERKKEIMKVTKEDIIKVAKKVHLDTVFLLEANNEEAE